MQFEIKTTGKSNTELTTIFECGTLQDAFYIADREGFSSLHDMQTGKIYKQVIADDNEFPKWIRAKPEITYHVFKYGWPVNPKNVLADCLTLDEVFASLYTISTFLVKSGKTEESIKFMAVVRQNDKFRPLDYSENRLLKEWDKNHRVLFTPDSIILNPDSIIRKKPRITFHVSVDSRPGYTGKIELSLKDVIGNYNTLKESVAGKTAIVNYCNRNDKVGNLRSCAANSIIIAREFGKLRGVTAREQNIINDYQQDICNVFDMEPDSSLSAPMSVLERNETVSIAPTP